MIERNQCSVINKTKHVNVKCKIYKQGAGSSSHEQALKSKIKKLSVENAKLHRDSCSVVNV